MPQFSDWHRRHALHTALGLIASAFLTLTTTALIVALFLAAM